MLFSDGQNQDSPVKNLRARNSTNDNPQSDDPKNFSLERSLWSDKSATVNTVLDSTTPNVFEAIGLKKDFDDGAVKALRNLDLQIPEGEFIAITGPSGCGKTTLLQLLGALDLPTAGQLLFRGTSIPDLRDPSAYRSKQIGFVFSFFSLLPTFLLL